MIAKSVIFPALAFCALTAGAAMAQETAPAMPDMAAAYESARNQLGVMTYCQDKGFAGAGAVETQTRLLTMIPPGDVARGDAAENLGKAGTVSAMGVETSLADAAVQQNTTEEAMCKQMETLLQQLAAQLPS